MLLRRNHARVCDKDYCVGSHFQSPSIGKKDQLYGEGGVCNIVYRRKEVDGLFSSLSIPFTILNCDCLASTV